MVCVSGQLGLDGNDEIVAGGIGPETIGRAAQAGANVFVAGTAIFGTTDYREAIEGLRKTAEAASR